MRRIRFAHLHPKRPNVPSASPLETLIIVPRQKFVDVDIPQVFSLRENYSETIAVIDKLRTQVIDNCKPVLLLFDNVKSIEPAAILILAAEIERCRRFRRLNRGLIINGTYPSEMDVFLQLREMGFYKLIGVPERSEIPDDRESVDRPRFLKFFTFSQVLAGMAAQLSDLFSVGAFAMTDLVRGRMTGALKEAMGNAVEHAYVRPGRFPVQTGKWWCAAYVNPFQSEMMIILYDQGVGIPETLDATLFEAIKAIVTTRAWQPGDGHMIAAATELFRTSTGQSGRGRGFRDMKKFIDSCDDGELRVLSNRGSYCYMKGMERISDEVASICGTLVEWRVRHGQPVDF